jgi:hypothetical protein
MSRLGSRLDEIVGIEGRLSRLESVANLSATTKLIHLWYRLKGELKIVNV